MRRSARVASGAVLVAASVVLVLGVVAARALGGGTPPDVAAAAAAETAVRAANQQDLRAVVSAIGVDPGSAVATGRSTSCTRGQENWKRHDGFVLSCGLSDVLVVRGGPRESFATDMTALDAALVRSGWASFPGGDMQQSLQYWQDREAVAGSGLVYPAQLPVPGYVPEAAGTSALRSASLPGGLSMTISWTQRGDSWFAAPAAVDGGERSWHADDGPPMTAEEVQQLAPEGGYLVLLTMSRAYAYQPR